MIIAAGLFFGICGLELQCFKSNNNNNSTLTCGLKSKTNINDNENFDNHDQDNDHEMKKANEKFKNELIYLGKDNKTFSFFEDNVIAKDKFNNTI